MAGLPDQIKALAERTPVEDLMLAVLRDGLPGVEVKTLIADDQTFPFVLVRRITGISSLDDPRFIDSASIAVHVFVPDPNGDEDAAILSEAVRVVIRDAWLSQKVYPGLGHITYMEMSSAPRRVTDWATATGPVQYADLPSGVWRYETHYHLEIRKPLSRPYPLPTP